MSTPKKHFIFIVQTDANELLAARQIDVDNAIKDCEERNLDIDFKVIGKIAEPSGPNTLPIDFNEQLIEWYEADEKDKLFIKRTILAIVNLLTYGS